MEETERLFLPIRFGVFEVDLQAGELRRQGYKVKLQEQPFQVLVMLLARPGQVVTRDELQNKLWGTDTFVDFERGLNRAINKLRQALGDDADSPRFIETLPRRGYRFLTPIETMGARQAEAVGKNRLLLVQADLPRKVESNISTGAVPKRQVLLWVAVSIVAVVVAAIGMFWYLPHRPAKPQSELTERRLTFNSSASPIESAAISRDGKYLAYSEAAGIRIRLLATGEERYIATSALVPAGAFSYVDSWFPNGTELLAHSRETGGHGTLWAVSIMGMSSRELRADARGWEVSPDGTRIAFSPMETGSGREIWVMDSKGGNAHKVLGLAADESLWSVHWSPDGQRLAYIRVHPPGQLVETYDLKDANRTTVVAASGRDAWVRSICWLPDRRIVYSRAEAADMDANLWQIGIDTPTGTPIGKPKRITRWIGSDLQGLSANDDGTRLVLRKETTPYQTYIGELTTNRMPMNPTRRLTYDDADNWATAWNADSKEVLFSSDRNGKWGIFKQRIGKNTAEPLLEGQEKLYLPRLSPDGLWVLYVHLSPVGPHLGYRLMRVPVNGGVPKLVFETSAAWWEDHECARSPANLCVVIESSPDEKQMTVTALDPLKGKGKLLRTLERNVHEGFTHSLSPDGSTLAIARGDEPEIHIRLLSLVGGSDREIAVKGWPNIESMEWSPDGKGLYCGSGSSQGGTLLFVDLKGTEQNLWSSREVDGGPFIAGVPSPDGRYLALTGAIRNSTAWMVEGF